MPSLASSPQRRPIRLASVTTPALGAMALCLGWFCTTAAWAGGAVDNGITISVRGTQMAGPDQDDRGEPDWLAA